MGDDVERYRQVAAVLGAQTALTLGVAIWQLVGLSRGDAARPEVAWGSSTYFLLVAVVVGALAYFAWRGARWIYGPAVFLQVLCLPLAASMGTEGFWVGAVALGALAVAGLVLLVSEAGRDAYGRTGLGGG
ncbi:MAG: hypothetical protein WCA29_10235 [Jiangellales bacterium]